VPLLLLRLLSSCILFYTYQGVDVGEDNKGFQAYHSGLALRLEQQLFGVFEEPVFATVAWVMLDSVRCSECCLSARDFDETRL